MKIAQKRQNSEEQKAEVGRGGDVPTSRIIHPGLKILA